MAQSKVLRFTVNFSLGFIFLLLFLFGTQPPNISRVLLVYIVFLSVATFVYLFAPFKSHLIGVELRGVSALRSFIFGSIFGGGFLLATKLIPGASIGLPLLPGAVSDSLEAFVIIILAPVSEELIFRGAILGYLSNIFKNKRNAIIISALLFALAHLSAYISGFYSYPDLPQALSSLGANIGSFIPAFAFGLLSAWFVSKDKIRNLLFSIIFHAFVNLVIFTNLAIIFA